jgi:alanine dehydrogenase
VIALKNPNWPGWVTVASTKAYSSIYIGYAIKLTQPSFYPLGPDDLNVESDEIE